MRSSSHDGDTDASGDDVGTQDSYPVLGGGGAKPKQEENIVSNKELYVFKKVATSSTMGWEAKGVEKHLLPR